MLSTYSYFVKDSDSDVGNARVTIVAESESEALKMLRELCIKKDRMELFPKFKMVHTKPYHKGVVVDN